MEPTPVVHLSGWEGGFAGSQWHGQQHAAAFTPPRDLQQQHGYAAAAPATAARVFHTTETLSLESPPSAGYGSQPLYGYGCAPLMEQQGEGWPPLGAAPQPAPEPAASPHYLAQLERHNSELVRQCQGLQEQLRAAAAAADAAPTAGEPSPGASPAGAGRRQRRGSPASQVGAGAGGQEADPEEMSRLQRRLASKEREAEAAAAAAAAKQQQAAVLEGELEREREKSAALADDVARWRDECAERDRELRSLQQRLEAASSHASLLEDGSAALKKQNAQLGTALAQRDVTIRQLEDRLGNLRSAAPSKDQQVEALHAEGEELRREAAALRQQNVALQADVQRLEEELGLARQHASALRAHNADLAAAVAAGASGAAASGPWQAAPAQQFGRHPPAPEAALHAMPATYEQQAWAADPRASVALAAGGVGGTPRSVQWQQQQQQRWEWQVQQDGEGWQAPQPLQPSWQPVQLNQQQQQQQEAEFVRRSSYSEAGSAPRTAFQPHNQPATAPDPDCRALPAIPHSAACSDAPADSDARSSASRTPSQPASQQSPPWLGRWPAARGGAAGAGAGTPGIGSGTPAGTPPRSRGQGLEEDRARSRPPFPYASRSPSELERMQTPGGGGSVAVGQLAGRLGSVSLGTPASASSPFGTEQTLQDMLARTQALEDQLLCLNAERNELEAESARMPSHTNGRTLQERKRRAEVERRLEEIDKEVSGVRLQLRRLGVK